MDNESYEVVSFFRTQRITASSKLVNPIAFNSVLTLKPYRHATINP
jgi:hypothetical protein